MIGLNSVFNLVDMALPIVMNILYAIVVLVVGLLVIKWISNRVTAVVDKKKVDPTLKPYIKSAVSIGLKALLIVALITILGIPTTSFVALFGAAGLTIGLAFQGTLTNFAGGILLLATKPFKVGDYIEAAGYSGSVEATQILYTDLVTFDNKVVRIPNGSLSNQSIVNYSEKETRRVDMKFSASYTEDSAKVIRILSEIVAAHPLVLAEPAPFVRMVEHANSAVIYAVRTWVKNADYWTVNFDVVEQVKKRFDEENIEIPFPQMDIHMDQLLPKQ
ncbi:MAG: mechanosensitive ion channel family protein [Clostridia bacterium]|nr:mechanosensitive ion channel family protein [Clostridia bacterium]